MPRNNMLQIRRGTASEWLSVNPVLASGEFGLDYSNNILKIGDGNSTWTELDQFTTSSGYENLTNKNIENSNIGINVPGTGNFSVLTVDGTPVSLSGHSHLLEDLTNLSISSPQHTDMLFYNSGTNNWDVKVSADDTNEALKIEVKHDYGNNVTFSATVWATETRL